MIEDYPNTNLPPQPQGKLILPPVYPEQQAYDNNGRTQQVPLGYEQLMHQPAGPAVSFNPFSKIRRYWRIDPAHKFLIIAVSLAIMAGLVFTTFVSVALAQLAAPQGTQPVLSLPLAKGIANTQPTVTVTADNGQANITNNQPTPTPMPSPTPQPTPTVGQLTLAIIDIPNRVDNNTPVQVVVRTNQPGTNVQLIVSYSTNATFAPPPNGQQADDNGIATIAWLVRVLPTKRTVTAKVMAIASDQNGQQVESKTKTVLINTRVSGR